MWVGLIYAFNGSSYRMRFAVKPEMDGLDVISEHPQDAAEFLQLPLLQGQDDVLILKRTKGDCKFGMKSKIENY